MKTIYQTRFILILALFFILVSVACTFGPPPAQTGDIIENPGDPYRTGVNQGNPYDVEPVKRTQGIQIGVNLKISSIDTDGGILVLEDGTKWEVQLIHRIKSRNWMPGSASVKIEKDSDPMYPDYNYILIESQGNIKVSAKYLGQE